MIAPDISDARLLDALLRNDLVAFTHKVFAELNPGRPFQPNWHHDAMAYGIEVCALTGEFNRLLINLPPRSLKSILVSVALPAFLLGRDPTKKIIVVCYNQELSNDFSRKTRQIMRADWYQRLFPSTRIAGKGAEGLFYTTKGGFRMATSVEGTLTGRGGDLIILDDPQKAIDASSEARRESLYKWILETLFTRLDDKREGAIMLVQQRLHEQDLSGQLMKSEGWYRVNLPAIAHQDESICLGRSPLRFHHRRTGDLLDPVREPQHVLDGLKRDMGEAAFLAQYQQDPIPPEGDRIKLAWFKTYDELPSGSEVVMSVDTASKAGLRNDYSVVMLWWVWEGRYYLSYIWRRKVEYPELRRSMMSLVDQLQPDTILIEDKGAGTGLIQEFRDLEGFYPVVGYDPGGNDKETRMRIQSAKIEQGLVLLPPEAPWLTAFLDEVRRFPNGVHDDQIDAMSQFLDHMSGRDAGRLIVTSYRT